MRQLLFIQVLFIINTTLVKTVTVTNERYVAGSWWRASDTVLRRGGWRGGSVLLKVILGFSILVAVRPQ